MIAFLLSSGSVAVSDNHANAEAMAESLGATSWREVDSLPDAPQERWVWTDAGSLGVAPIDHMHIAIQARTTRNTLLMASDWTQVADAPVDQAAWATYRQALRDITAQAGFPETIDWPVAPE